MEWIKVEEDLPIVDSIVLACDELNSFVSLAKYRDHEDEYWFDLMYVDEVEIDSIVTHWMPIPKLPQEK